MPQQNQNQGNRQGGVNKNDSSRQQTSNRQESPRTPDKDKSSRSNQDQGR